MRQRPKVVYLDDKSAIGTAKVRRIGAAGVAEMGATRQRWSRDLQDAGSGVNRVERVRAGSTSVIDCDRSRLMRTVGSTGEEGPRRHR